jgi:uncharacterized protein YkwD
MNFPVAATALLSLSVMIAAASLSPQAVIQQVNKSRTQTRLKPLTINKALMKAAQKKAGDMAARNYFNHNSPDGKTPWDFMSEAGYNHRAAAENIAGNYATPDAVVKGWMASPGHRANILNRQFTETGVGIAKGKSGYIIVQMFGQPMGNR